MIVSDGLVALDEAEPGIPDIGLQRPGSLALTLRSIMLPSGQVPLARALPPPALLAAPGPVGWLPGKAVGAGVGEVIPVVAEGLAMPGEAGEVELVVELGLELGLVLDTPPLVLPLVPPVVPPDDVWALAIADRPSSDAATRDKSLKVFMGWLPSWNDGNQQPAGAFVPDLGLPEIGTK